MQALKVLVVVMGVLIVAGVVVVVTTIAGRISQPGLAAAGGPAALVGASVVLDEPAGTHVSGSAVAGGSLAVTLAGGGPDRVVVLDLASGRVLRRVALAR